MDEKRARLLGEKALRSLQIAEMKLDEAMNVTKVGSFFGKLADPSKIMAYDGFDRAIRRAGFDLDLFNEEINRQGEYKDFNLNYGLAMLGVIDKSFFSDVLSFRKMKEIKQNIQYTINEVEDILAKL